MAANREDQTARERQHRPLQPKVHGQIRDPESRVRRAPASVAARATIPSIKAQSPRKPLTDLRTAAADITRRRPKTHLLSPS